MTTMTVRSSVPASLERRDDSREALVDRQQHLEPGADVAVRCRGRRPQRRHALERSQQRGLADRRGSRVGPAWHTRSRIATLVPGSRNKSLALPGHGARTAIVVLDDVRVQRLMREEDEERFLPGLPDEAIHVPGQQVGDVADFLDARAVPLNCGSIASPGPAWQPTA